MNDCKEAAMTVPQRVLDTMNSGLIYPCDDEEMIKAQKEQMELLYDFNATRPSQMTQRKKSHANCLANSARTLISNRRYMPIGDATRISVRTLTPISTLR